MRYYGTHKFEEYLIGNECKFDNVSISNILIIPNNYSTYPGAVFFNGNSVCFVDSMKNIMESVNKEEIFYSMSSIDFMNKTFFKINNSIDVSSKIYLLGDFINIIPFNAGKISLKITKLDLTGSNDPDNIYIVDATIDGYFEYANKSKLNEILNTINIYNIPISLSLLLDSTEFLYNNINNELNISYLYDNTYNINGILYLKNNILNIDSSILNLINDNTTYVYYDITTDNLYINIKYYNITDFSVDENNKILYGINIPYHKHELDDLYIGVNNKNGILYINNNGLIDISEETKIKNIIIESKNNIINWENRISDNIYKCENLYVNVDRIDITTDIDFTFEEIGGNTYYYPLKLHYVINNISNISYNNYKEKYINISFYDAIDITDDIENYKEYFNNNLLFLYLTKNIDNTFILKTKWIDYTNINEYKKMFNLYNDFEVEFLLGIFKFKLDQQYITNPPIFLVDSTVFEFGSNTNSRSIIIPSIYMIELFDSPIIFNITSPTLLYLSNNIDFTSSETLKIYGLDNTNLINNLFNCVDISENLIGDIPITNGITYLINGDYNKIRILPPLGNSKKITLYMVNI